MFQLSVLKCDWECENSVPFPKRETYTERKTCVNVPVYAPRAGVREGGNTVMFAVNDTDFGQFSCLFCRFFFEALRQNGRGT